MHKFFCCHLLLKIRRQPFWTDLWLFKTIKICLLLFASIPLLFMSLSLDYLLEVFFHKNILVSLFITSFGFLLVDFLIKVRFLQFDNSRYLPYTTLPIKTYKIIFYEALQAMFSGINLYGLVLVLPFLIRIVYEGKLSVSLFFAYAMFVYVIELLVYVLVRWSKNARKVIFLIVSFLFVAVCLCGIYYLQSINLLPLSVVTILYNPIVIWLLVASLFVVCFFSFIVVLKKNLRRLYELSDGISERSAFWVNKISYRPTLLLYILSIFRCRQFLYLITLLVFIIVAVACKFSVFTSAQMLSLSIVFCMSVLCVYPPAMLLSTCADCLVASSARIIKQLLYVSFYCSVVWSGFLAVIFAFITKEYQLCFCSFLVCNGSVFYTASGCNPYVRERFDLMAPSVVKHKLDFRYAFRQFLPIAICMLLSQVYTLSNVVFIVVSLLLSVPFILCTKMGIDRHVNLFVRNKYDYLNSVRG